MKPLFQNITVMDKHMAARFYAVSWPKNLGFLAVALSAVGVFAVAYGVFYIMAGGSGAVLYGVAMFLMAAGALFLAFFGYLLRLGRYVQAQQKLWGGPILQKQVDFFDEDFTQTTRLGRSAFRYDMLTGVTCRRGVVVLWMGKYALVMDDAGFAKGGHDAFLLFIREKTKENRKNMLKNIFGRRG